MEAGNLGLQQQAEQLRWVVLSVFLVLFKRS